MPIHTIPQDLVLNREPRCPLLLLLDNSSAMVGEPLDQLNKYLLIFSDILKGDSLVRHITEIAIVSFGYGGNIQDFVIANDFVPPALPVGIEKSMKMDDAIVTGLNLLRVRKNKYDIAGINYFHPWLFLITDGKSTDFCGEAVRRIHDGDNAKEFWFHLIATKGADFDSLTRIALPNHSPLQLITDSDMLRRMLKLLSSSLSAIPNSRPNLPRTIFPEKSEIVDPQLPKDCRLSSSTWLDGCTNIAKAPDRWNLISAVVRGTSKIKRNESCQDAVEYAFLKNEIVIAAVADGAGTAKHSDIGAKIAVQTTVSQLSRRLRRGGLLPDGELQLRKLASRTVRDVRQVLKSQKLLANHRFSQLSCTLLCVISTPKRILAFQIGDGFIVMRIDNREEYSLLFLPERGEYANQTYFITNKEVERHLQIADISGAINFVCLSSDGLEYVALDMNLINRSNNSSPPRGSAPAKFFGSLEQSVHDVSDSDQGSKELGDFLDTPQINQHTDDDKSMILFWRLPVIPAHTETRPTNTSITPIGSSKALRQGSSQKPILICELLSRGDESSIYQTSVPNLAAKIYHNPVSNNMADKLAIMICNHPKNPIELNQDISIAWPVDTLFDGEACVGYLTSIIPDSHSLRDVIRPAYRLKSLNSFNLRHLHKTARNVAKIFHQIHIFDCVVGDVNMSNLRVTSTALVTMVDTDLFQIKDRRTGKIYRCSVATPEFIAPELVGKKLDSLNRNVSQDYFGLTMVIYKLLFGEHPCQGRWDGAVPKPTHKELLYKGHYVQDSASPISATQLTIPETVFHPNLIRLFKQSFGVGYRNPVKRPTAQDWITALDMAIDNLDQCSTVNKHYYDRNNEICPWCKRAKILKLDVFSDV